MRINKSMTMTVAAAAVLMASGCSSDSQQVERGDEIVLLDVAVLEAPSLTSFYAPIIDGLGLDLENGIDINFVPKSAIVLRTEMANGSAQLSAGATVLTDAALLNEKGADVRYLFNTYDWWGTVLTPSSSDIQSIKDLEGQKIVGALATTNYAMFKITAGLSGVDLNSLQETNTSPAGLVATAKSGREQAVQVWEPAHTAATQGNDEFRSLDLVGALREATGLDVIPYVGIAAQNSWIESNEALINPLYATFKAAATYIAENPDDAAQLIAEATGVNVEAMSALLSSPDRFGMNVYPAKDASSELEILLQLATDSGILTEMPELSSTIYQGQIGR